MSDLDWLPPPPGAPTPPLPPPDLSRLPPPEADGELLDFDDRADALDTAVIDMVAHGARVEQQTDTYAVVLMTRPLNHVLHAVLMLVTVGLWGIVWLYLGVTHRTERRLMQVDERGELIIRRA